MRYFLFVLTLIFPASLSVAQNNAWVAQTSNTSSGLNGVDFINKDTGWVVGESGTILKSTTDGFSWIPESSGVTSSLNAVDFIDALHGFAVGGCDGCSDGVILKTTDGGASWTSVDFGRNLIAVRFTSLTHGWAVGPNGLILATTDGGNVWNIQLSNVDSYLSSVFFTNDSTGYVSGSFPGVLLKTTDAGSTWVSLTNGINPDYSINDVFFTNQQTGWTAGYGFPDTVGVGIIKKTTNGGATWNDQVSGSNELLLSVSFVSVSQGWIVGSSGAILTTTNGGTSWSPDSSRTLTELNKIVVRQGEGAWAVGLNGTILRNNFGPLLVQVAVTMNGKWNLVSLPVIVDDKRPISVFPTSTPNSAYLYRQGSGYLRSDTLAVGIGYWLKFSGSQIATVTGLELDSVTVHCLTGWNLVGGISKDVQVSSIAQNPSNSIRSVYGYDAGYFPALTIERGKGYWVKCSNECFVTLQSGSGSITGKNMTDISLLNYEELPPNAPGESTSKKSEMPTPTEYGLGQNYPNPFNPTTVISYQLPEPSRVVLKVYNMLGQEVKTLLDESQSEGYKSVEWNVENTSAGVLPSGIYIYKIHAASLITTKQFTEVKKLMLIK